VQYEILGLTAKYQIKIVHIFSTASVKHAVGPIEKLCQNWNILVVVYIALICM